MCRGTEETGTDTKNMGAEETNPRRPRFGVTGKNTGTGAGDRRSCNEKIAIIRYP